MHLMAPDFLCLETIFYFVGPIHGRNTLCVSGMRTLLFAGPSARKVLVAICEIKTQEKFDRMSSEPIPH